ncbi:MAG TPA: response regulator [Candidatus Kaiserbacteria bacterium]|nr:response regulator [Candidatus Kaiserbacteria bacterium]
METSYTIFLVDDDQFLLSMYVAKFQSSGHKVISFTSGRELLGALRERVQKIDALLLDIIMPDMNGFEILEELRREKLAQGAKIIILSNQGQDADMKHAKQFNVDGYIVKASAIPSEVVENTINIIEQKTS